MASNPGDVVLDPFCGCGTTIAAAESLGRTWIGIDLTHLAVNLIRTRLKDMYPECAFEVIGEPQDEKGARELAGQNRHQFEYWALSLVDARPATGQRKRGADSGVDGVLYVIDNPKEPPKKIVVQVKSGKVGVSLIRDFAHVIEREEAAMGWFVTLEPPTKPMETEAAGAGVYEPTLATRGSLAYPRLQILTISDLLEGQRPELPSVHVTYKASARAKPKAQQPSLFD
jgi:site-specific DNA-methyltransferase (adenine-specific)